MITVRDMENWLEEHDHNEYTRNGVQTIYDTWYENKKDMIEKFRKHPNWDEDAMAIILKESTYNRGFNKNAIFEFKQWVRREISKTLSPLDKYIERVKINQKISAINDMISYYNKIEKAYKAMDECALINGEPMKYVLMEKLAKLNEEDKKYINVNGYDVERSIGEKYEKAIKALDVLTNAESHLMTQNLADMVNEILDVKAVAGQKISKVIRKICCTIGVDQIKEINNYGSYTRDDGFNRKYAMLTDEINPLNYKRITVISLNPLDYWSMSHGKNWVSCHYVGDDDDGCYSSGSTSYMLDKTSVIYYIIDEKYEGNTYHAEPKEKRCVFAIEESGDVILQSRVYPDGRDGGDQTLASQFRAVVQRIVSELWNKNNYWDLKKGKEYCKEYVETTGTHYPDYTYYDDCNISLNKGASTYPRIHVGHYPICPCCGTEHDLNDNISCCGNGRYECAYCGDRFGEDNDDRVYCEENDQVYCCEECAERDGVHWCQNDQEFHTENYCFYDDYLGEWIYGEPEIRTVDERCYASIENAESDGNSIDWYTEDWYSEDDMVWCDKEGVWAHPDNGEPIYTKDGEYFTSEQQAEEYGYVYIEGNNEWIKEEDSVYCEDEDILLERTDDIIETSDGKYFTSEEAAREYGYVENDGKWVEESEVA